MFFHTSAAAGVDSIFAVIFQQKPYHLKKYGFGGFQYLEKILQK
jgi:hypothetical protein